MFSVYGKSLQAAKKTVGKQMMNNKSDISVELKKMNDATQTDKQLIVDKHIDDVFKNMKSKRCTHEFSTPHIAQEAYQLMKNDTANFSDLRIMKKRPKKNAEGNVLTSKATRKPLMEWVPLYEEEQAKEAA